MYNSEIKRKYLEEHKDKYCKGTLHKIEVSFDRVQHYEERLHKDIYQMSADEIVLMFAEANIKKQCTIQTYRSVYRKYVQWCVMEFGLKYNPFDWDASVEYIVKRIGENKSLKSKRYFTQKEFQNFLKEVRKGFSENLAEYIVGVLMAIHEGIKGNRSIDLIMLRLSDIDEENRTVSLSSGKKIKVSQELIMQLKKVEKIDLFKYNAVYGVRESHLRGKLYEDTIFKFFIASKKTRNEMIEISERNIRNMTDRFQSCIKDRVSAMDVYECGLIHHVHKSYCRDGGNDFLNDLSNIMVRNDISTYLFEKSDIIRYRDFMNKYAKVIAFCI